MNKFTPKSCLLALALMSCGLATYADKYVIYPIPQSISMGKDALPMTSKVNLISESTIDKTTVSRLKSILESHGIECLSGAPDANCVSIRLGTVGSGEEVEAFAFNDLALKQNRIMVNKKFDRHAISVSEHGITILGEHTNAVFFALASLEQMLEQMNENALEYVTIYDRADQQNRGLVEGYYGYPYSVEVKKELMRYMMRYKMNTYMYGAKSDPYHSQMWKDPYPTSISEQQEKNGWLTQTMVSELAQVSEDTKVNFIWAIHPGNEFLGSNTVIDDIMSKFAKMHALGIRHFGVFVDDVSIPSSNEDMKKNADRLTELQKKIEKKWNTASAAPEDTVRPLHFVPQIYCNSFASSVDQRQRFMSALSKVPSYITVYSTGQGVWSVPNNDHTATIINEFSRPMAWWWNYPCNDNADGQLFPMDMYNNFIDMPAVGDSERLPSTLNNCQGIIANPMQQGAMARTPLFSIADYAWNNASFNNEKSWEASFKSIIADADIRQAYHDITYYLRWNEPATLNAIINNYKSSLESGAPNSQKILQTIQKIKQDCQTVMRLKDSSTNVDRLLYTDIAPWLHTLHTYTLITEKMINILDASSPEQHLGNWAAVKEVCDSLEALDRSTLYTAYALEGMGNGISVSERQAQLSRKYLYPFIAYLKEKAITTYFNQSQAISAPVAIANSPLLSASINDNGASVSMTLAPSNFDVNNYVGLALPTPKLIADITLHDSLLPYARYSTNGKDWLPVESASALMQKYVAYFIFLNDGTQGIANFAITPDMFSLTFATQAKAVEATLPSGAIYEDHNAKLIIDGNYATYACLNRNQTNADKYVIDLGAETTIHDVRLCMGTVNDDHPLTARIQCSADGKKWTTLNIMGTTNNSWSISTEQNVKYSNEMVYCNFDGEGTKARYVRLYVSKANTNKWLRLYEIEVNRTYAENGTLAQCQDANNTPIRALTDRDPLTGITTAMTSPVVFNFYSQHDVQGLNIYTKPGAAQAQLSVSTNGTDWTPLPALTEAAQHVDLKAHPKAKAMRIEWTGNQAPAIFEVMPIYDATTSSLPAVESTLANAFAQLKAQALQALDSCGVGEKLITRNSQFSSPYTETMEGSLNNLLDGKQNTFWHSSWSAGAAQDGVHYLEISLPDETVGDVVMHYGRRSDTDGHHLIKANILGVVSGSGTSAQTELVCQLDMPYKSQTETIVRQFTLPRAYSAIRLQELQTSGDMKGPSAGFFHIGEFQLYSTSPYYEIKGAHAVANALIEACTPLPSEATAEQLQALQAAYDAFMHEVFGIIPSGINTTPTDAPNASAIYDLQGRRVAHPTKGAYIVNGKKVLY